MANALKIRIGIGLGTLTAAGRPGTFDAIVDRCESLGFDSLWMSERISSPAPDPLLALAVAAARTERMKLGTSVLVLPGRNPVVLAKALASLDVLSGGRFLPAVGLGAVDPVEQRAFGVERSERGARHDEMLEIMRRCWTGEPFSFHGEYYDFDDIVVEPRPTQERLDVWLGGIAPSELRRVGRVGDGWLPSFCTPDDIVDCRPVIERAAADAGRSIDPQHYGALVAYSDGPLPDRFVAAIERRLPGRDPRTVIPDRDGLADVVQRFIDVDVSKFVIVPLAGDVDPDRELGLLADALLPLEN